jgi:hypothetical protein
VVLKGVRAVPDVAFEALRLEFGLGGIKGRPHWRPVLRKFAGIGILGFAETRKNWELTMMDPSFKGWKSLPSAPQISASKLRDFQKFQQMVNIRV